MGLIIAAHGSPSSQHLALRLAPQRLLSTGDLHSPPRLLSLGWGSVNTTASAACAKSMSGKQFLTKARNCTARTRLGVLGGKQDHIHLSCASKEAIQEQVAKPKTI